MHIPKLLSQAEFSDAGPNKKILYDAPALRSVLFSLKGGQEVQRHTAPAEVVMYVVSGEGVFYVGDASPDVKQGSLVVCRPKESHGFRAKGDMVVLVAVIMGTPSPQGGGAAANNVIDLKGSAICSTGPFAPNIVYFSPSLKVPVICLTPPQEIPPHPGATGVFHFTEGNGIFTSGEEKIEVSAGSLMAVPMGGIRGIKPEERLILFAVHAGTH